MSGLSSSLRILIFSCAALAIVGAAAAQQPAAPQAQPSRPATGPAAQKPPMSTPGQPQRPTVFAPAPAPKDPIVATINGQPIRLSDLEVAQQALPPQYRTMPLQAVFPALLDRLIDSKLVVLEGKKNKIQDDIAFKKRMAFVEEQVIQDFWMQREIARRVTPEKLQERYTERSKAMPPEEEVRARHILLSTEDEAKAAIAEIKKGASFDKLARETSTDKASGAEGGELGWFKKSDMVPEFAAAAFALQKGETSATPIKTQFGYHVIELEDRRQAPPPPFEEMAEQLREEASRETAAALLNQLRSNAKVEKFNIDGSRVEPAAPDASLPPASAKPETPPK